MTSFSGKIVGWSRKVYKIRTRVYQIAMMDFVERLQELVPYDTGFLRASLVAAKDGTPRPADPHPGGVSYLWDPAQVYAVVMNAEYGEKIFLGYTAEYAPFVHYGAGGRPPRPWVTMAAQQWRDIVAQAAVKAKAEIDAETASAYR